MRGLWLEGGSVRFRDDLDAPVPRQGWSRVRVVRAGVCATDLALARGYMGFTGVPGHEFVGVALDGPWVGQRVVGEINAACGSAECQPCASGLGRHCPERSVLGILGHAGAFAEELQLPDANLLPVPDAVDDDAATFTEPLAAAFEIPEQLELRPGTPALVAGDGRLGLLCAWVLALRGLDVTVAGRHADTRRALLPDSVTFLEGLLEDGAPPPTQRYPLAVEATGNPDVLARLIRAVEPRGTVVLKTTTERPAQIDLAPLVVDEISLVGSRCGPFAPALEALATGRIPLDRFVQGRYRLEDGAEALSAADRRGVLKILIDPQRGA